MKTLAWAFGLAMLFAPAAMAQTHDELVKGATDTNNVLNHGMGYNLQRFSALKQINKDTIKRLVPVWNYSFDDNRSEESQPLVYKGVLYVTTNSATMAIDAKTGKQIWKTKVEYPPETPRIVCCGIINRGAAIYDGKIFRTTLDANVIALDAQTGKELWRKNAIDFKTGYSMTVAPLVADGVVITGISGAEFGTRDFIDGWDPKTGEHLWRTYTVPGPGEPGNETWQGDTWKLGGGSTWITGSFDPELHTVYWGVGNPGPFNAAVRPGDNLYTCSVIALDPKSGKIKWHFQFSPNNPFDYDSVAEMVLATLNIDGKPTPVLMDANRNGYFYVLDRTNGKLLAANPYVRVNWASGIDMKTGRPIETDISAKARAGEKVVVWPSIFGGKNWEPMSFNPQNNTASQYAQYRRPLQGLAGRIQGRRMVCRYGSKRSVGMAGRTAWLSQGDRSVDRQDQVGRLKRHSTLLRRALDRRRPRLLRAVDRRVRSLRRRHRQEAVAVPDRLRH
jgi:alcohol dehydrogenase (cytochrome c)